MTIYELTAVTPEGVTFAVTREDWGMTITYANARQLEESIGFAEIQSIKPKRGERLQVELKVTGKSAPALDFSDMPNAYEAYVLGYGK
jgi:hypothetical protein